MLIGSRTAHDEKATPPSSHRFSPWILSSSAKVPVSKAKSNFNGDLQVPVSPTSSESLEDELMALRARNKVLSEALTGVNESATKAFKKNFDLVWFARNRGKCLLLFL